MAVRIRADGRIVCAAQSDPEPGDCYLDDAVHARLAGAEENSLHVLVTDDEGDTWEFINSAMLAKAREEGREEGATVVDRDEVARAFRDGSLNMGLAALARSIKTALGPLWDSTIDGPSAADAVRTLRSDIERLISEFEWVPSGHQTIEGRRMWTCLVCTMAWREKTAYKKDENIEHSSHGCWLGDMAKRMRITK